MSRYCFKRVHSLQVNGSFRALVDSQIVRVSLRSFVVAVRLFIRLFVVVVIIVIVVLVAIVVIVIVIIVINTMINHNMKPC